MADSYTSLVEPYSQILARMEDRFTQLAGYTPDDASDIGIRMKVLAGEIYSVSCAADWLKRQTFAQYATGLQLEERAMERGIKRKPAAPARGTLTFGRKTPLWCATDIPTGTVCASSGENAQKYVTAEEAILPAGELTVDVPAKAQTPGSTGNTSAETVTAMVTPPASVETVTNGSPFTGGTDAESDDSLKVRLLDCWNTPANGANAAWYRQTAESCDGVKSANVVPRASGTGTVAVYLGGEGCVVPDAAVKDVQQKIGAAREICTDVTVQAAETVPVNVACSVKEKAGQSRFTVGVYCHSAIQDYFYALRVGNPVIISAITAKLFATGLIDDCSFSTVGKSVAANQLAVLGNLAVQVT